MTRIVLLLLVSLHLLGILIPPALVNGVKIIDGSGATYDTECCRTKADEYITKAKKSKTSYCAVLFENSDCDSCRTLLSGWDEGIKAGKRTFGRLSRFREDSTSVIVAPGCIFVGYDESDEDDNNDRDIVTAVGRNDWVYKEFKVCNQYQIMDTKNNYT